MATEKSLPSKELAQCLSAVFVSIGTRPEDADFVARQLVASNLRGHDSHGALRVRQYVNGSISGQLVPGAQPEIISESASYASIDARRSYGQIACKRAMEIGIAKARETGLALIGVHNAYHIGRLGDYTSMASDEGLMATGFCNGGGPNVAPHGSRDRVLGTNPMACSVPTKSSVGYDLEIDFASAASAEGKLNVARIKGENVRPGLMQNSEGNPTENPNDFYDGGSIVPIGGQKGSALSLVLEILGGVFTGGRCSAFDDYVDGNGVLFLITRTDLFRPQENFDEDMSLIHDAVTGSQRAAGFDEVLFPGDAERRHLKESDESGIVLDPRSLEIIKEVCDEVDVSFPDN